MKGCGDNVWNITAIGESEPSSECKHGHMNTREEPASTSTSEQTITTTSVEISEENTGGKTCRSKRVVCVIEKLNMVFLVFFVCYLSWTIPANYGLFTSNGSGVDVNGTMGNAKGQNEEANSTGRKPDESSTNFTDFYTRTVQQFNDPHTGRQYPFKRRRKQKLKNGRKDVLNPNVLDTENNEILVDSKSERHKNKRNRNKNRNTKRRKSRRKQKKINFDNVLEPTTIRHIIETVAKEELAKGGNWNTHKGNGAPQVTLSVGDNSVIDKTQHSIRKNNKKGNGRRKIPPSGGKNRGEGKWSWSEWGPCSTTCGVGQKERNRKCGMACKEVESMVCFMPSCEGNGKQESGKKHFSSFYLWENDNFVPKPPGKDYIDPEVDNCGTWMDCNREVIDEYFEKTDLPSCPCTYPLHLSYNEKVWDKQKKQHYLWLDASGADEALAIYKPAAQYCIRSKLVPGTDTLAAQHCCYDSANRLITRGKSAGTPNLISPEISPELHQKVDISPWIICKGDWTRYNEIIPPNNIQECEENPRSKEFLRQVKQAKNF